MSLATLNKQRSVEKQSIRTTVTISKVSKTPVLTTTSMPITTSPSKKITFDGVTERNDLSNQAQTEAEMSKEIDEIPNADVAKRKEIAKEKFFNETNGTERRGESTHRSKFFFMHNFHFSFGAEMMKEIYAIIIIYCNVTM